MVARSDEVPWSLDREIVLSRVFQAPRELVFAAWTKEEHLTKWFGPKGFTTKTHECDVRTGGGLGFDMTAPGGKVVGDPMVVLENQVARPVPLVPRFQPAGGQARHLGVRA